MTPEEAKEWQKKNSPFLKFDDGQTVEVTVKDMKSIPDKDPLKETMRYIVVLADGSQKFWDSRNGNTAVKMSEAIAAGKKVRITKQRTGPGTQDVKYDVQVVA